MSSLPAPGPLPVRHCITVPAEIVGGHGGVEPDAHRIPPRPPEPPAPRVHELAAGDTLSAVADRFGTDLDAVLAANGLVVSSILYPGERVLLPGVGAAASGTASPRR